MSAPTLMDYARRARERQVELCMLIQEAHVSIRKREEAEERERRVLKRLAIVGPYVELNPEGHGGAMELGDPYLVECQGIRFVTPPLVCTQTFTIQGGSRPCVSFEWDTDSFGNIERSEGLCSPNVCVSEFARVVEAEPIKWRAGLARAWVKHPDVDKGWEETIWNLRGIEGWASMKDVSSLHALDMYKVPCYVQARSAYDHVRQCQKATVTLGWRLKLK